MSACFLCSLHFGSKAANHKLTRSVFPLRSAFRKEISQSESEFKICFLCSKHFRPVFSAVCIFISLANHEKAAKISILKILKALFENSACKGIINLRSGRILASLSCSLTYGGPQVSRQKFQVNTAQLKKNTSTITLV